MLQSIVNCTKTTNEIIKKNNNNKKKAHAINNIDPKHKEKHKKIMQTMVQFFVLIHIHISRKLKSKIFNI